MENLEYLEERENVHKSEKVLARKRKRSQTGNTTEKKYSQ